MSTKRILVSVIVLCEIFVIVPFAYSLLKTDRQDLDQENLLPNLLAFAEQLPLTNNEVWEWSPSLVFEMKALVEETDCKLNTWSLLVENISTLLQSFKKDFVLPLSVESSVIFHANLELLQDSVQKKVTTESMKKSLHKVIDEAEISRPGGDDRPVNLVATCFKNQTRFKSEYQSYRISGWGIVTFVDPLEDSLHIFEGFIREIVFGLRNNMSLKDAQNIAYHQGIFSVLQKLNATKLLADSMPHLPVSEDISIPFHEALRLTQQAIHEPNHFQKLALLRKASSLANAISSHPSLIPSLYISSWDLFAIFSPLILPTVLPLLIGAVQESKRLLRK